MVFVPLIASAQSKTVTGTINDDLGIPLPGVTVQVKNSGSLGAVTNFDGLFTISIPSDATQVLIFSYVGFATEEVNVSSTDKVTLNLKVDAAALDEVVVVGYGTVLKKDVTGSLSSVKVKDEVATQSASVDQLLQGRAAGVQVIQNAGAPGSGISVKIRGTSSLRGNNEPLYVIDGVIISSAGEDTDPISTGGSGGGAPQSGLNGINPRDIETMQVLKDASATAIYGSRGANGVVLITTKKGVKGKMKISAFMTGSLRTVAKKLDVLDGLGYANYINEFQEVKGFPNKYLIDGSNIHRILATGEVFATPAEIFDWQDEIYGTGFGQKVGVSASGGSDHGNYYISAGLSDEVGIVPNSKFKAIDFRVNLNQNLNDNLKLKASVSTFFSDSNFAKGGGGGGTNTSYVRNITSFRPLISATDDLDIDGEPIPLELQESNPFSFLDDFTDSSTENRYIGNLTLTYKFPIKGLSYEIKFGGNIRNKERRRFFGLTTNKGKNADGYFDVSTLDSKSYQFNNLLKFNRTFNKIHRFNTVFGVTYDVKKSNKSVFGIEDFLTTIFRDQQPVFATDVQQPLTFSIDNQQIFSLLGRLNYTFKNKYTLTATFRRDGVSKFQGDNKFGNFPSFALAWNAGNENFIKGLEVFESLKVRAGWGQIGNQAIRAYESLPTHNIPGNGFSYGNASGGNNIAILLSSLPNKLLTWETTEQLNFGLDFGLFNNLVSGSIDFYDKTTKDLLQRADIAPSNGFKQVTINKGSISNKGLEVALDFIPISTDNFELSVGGNIAFNKTKITNLGAQLPDDFYVNGKAQQRRFYFGNQISSQLIFDNFANVFVEGEEAGLFYGHQTDGIYQTEDPDILDGFVPGDVRIVDQNNDGVIDFEDRTFIGNPNPDLVYGLNLSLTYKRISFSALFNGVQGHEIVNGNLLELGTPFVRGPGRNILSQVYADAWRPDQQSNLQPRVGYDLINDSSLNDRIIEDGSFLRFRNVTIGYDFSVDKIDLFDSANIYIAGQNLFTWTDYSGYDPEITSFLNNGLIQGVDWNSAANARTILLGINVTF